MVEIYAPAQFNVNNYALFWCILFSLYSVIFCNLMYLIAF
ncbi:hypothetical protein PPHE_a0401 [Pseudoalteromonas phenolica O-BC30]|nr:hypothetical protein [Pseudoalteromonas phenolica O-BC30]